MASSPPTPDVPRSTLAAPQPTHPVAGRTLTDPSIEFQWTVLPDADRYRLQLAASEAFETVYYDEVVDGPTSVSVDEVLPDGVESIVWRVRVEKGEEATWSTPASFFVSELPGTKEEYVFVDAPPVPIRPIQGDAVEADGATLTWEEVPEASGYRIQVGASEAFEDPLVDLTLDQATFLTLYEALPGNQSSLYWRVRSLFPNDAEGPWSETVQFRTDPDLGDEAELAAEGEDDALGSEAPSVEQSAVAAGPARRSHTSSAMALTFILVLLVSFVITIFLILWAL